MNAKKLIALLLALLLALSVAPLALADDGGEGPITHDVSVIVNNKGEKTNLTEAEQQREDVTVEKESGSITVTVPGVEYTKQSGDKNGNKAAYAAATTADGHAALVVEGDVNLTLNENEKLAGVRANADQGMAEVQAKGVTVTGSADNTSEAAGVNASAKSGGIANVSIGEDGVSVTDINRADAMLLTANNGTVNAQVAGDVNASTNGQQNNNLAYGAKLTYEAAGTINLEIDGNVTADGTGRTGGLWIVGVEGSEANVTVTGDVSGEGYGLVLEGSKDAANTVVIEGTLSGGTEAIYLKPDKNDEIIVPENTDVYVWAIENPAEKPEEAPQAGTKEAAQEEVYTNNVHYIIRSENPKKGAKVTLDGVKTVEPMAGKELNYADEDDVVTLNVSVSKNYKLTGAYNDGVALKKDKSGNYSLVVPRGGGVYLTVSLEKLPNEKVVEENRIIGKTEDGIEIVMVSTKRFVLVTDDAAQFLTFRVEDGQVIFTMEDGTEVVMEEVDGRGYLTIELANGDTLVFKFSAADLARLKD